MDINSISVKMMEATNENGKYAQQQLGMDYFSTSKL